VNGADIDEDGVVELRVRQIKGAANKGVYYDTFTCVAA
jgi:hypothetical protein